MQYIAMYVLLKIATTQS